MSPLTNFHPLLILSNCILRERKQMIKLIKKWETDFITFPDVYGYGYLRLRKMKGPFKLNEIKTNKQIHDPLETMGLYLLFDLFKFYVINFCFAKISISAFDLIHCKLLILIWIQVLFLTFLVFFFYMIHQTYVLTTYKSCLLNM